MVVTKWTKTSDTPTQIDANMIDNQLTFPSPKLSHAGEYTCTIEVYDGTVLLATGYSSVTIHLPGQLLNTIYDRF